MANKWRKSEVIVQNLRQVDVLVGQGMARVDAICEVRATEQTFYRWRNQYGGMGTDQLKELKLVHKENERLRKAASDLTLDKLILRVEPIRVCRRLICLSYAAISDLSRAV